MAENEMNLLRLDIGESLETINEFGGPFGYRQVEGGIIIAESYTDEGTVDKVYKITVQIEDITNG
jgi:hypothetical protein